MKFNETVGLSCDVLVVGGGGAGLRAAVEARLAGADVLLVSKSRVGHANNTYISKSLIAAAGWGDSPDGFQTHLEDTMVGGRLLNDRELVSEMVRRAKGEISFLEQCGVAFAKDKGRFQINAITGHRFPRHVKGEHTTGSDLVLPLKRYAEKIGVRFEDQVFITRLFSSGERIAGATGVSYTGRFLVISAGSVILATGGFGQVYLRTNNAAGITGDGQALALDLGLPLKDMEFVQFYPTATGRLGNRLILFEILVAGEGAVLKNRDGEDIVSKYGLNDPVKLTRDRLAQALTGEISANRGVDGGILMDLSGISPGRLEQLRPLLPSAWQASEKVLVVAPTTHFCMGGIVIDKTAETPLPGLFAVGEVTAGIHGANRLGGNALCEVFTMGGIAGKEAARRAAEPGGPAVSEEEIAHEKAFLQSRFREKGPDLKAFCRSLKETMWLNAGIVRHPEGLALAMEMIRDIEAKTTEAAVTGIPDLFRCLELQNMLCVSESVCRAALLRTESRGSHFRADCPDEDPGWLRNVLVKKEGTEIHLESVSIPAK